jgi:hypothetical protein
MAAEREGVLLGARDPGLPRVVLGDQPGREIHIRVAVDQGRVRGDLDPAHRHQAHRLGTAGDDHRRRAAHDALGGVGDRLQTRGAETVDGDGRCAHRNPRAQARDPRHVHPLLGLRHRAAEDHIIDFARIDPRRAFQCLGNGDGAELVGPRAAQCPARRFARRGSDR